MLALQVLIHPRWNKVYFATELWSLDGEVNIISDIAEVMGPNTLVSRTVYVFFKCVNTAKKKFTFCHAATAVPMYLIHKLLTFSAFATCYTSFAFWIIILTFCRKQEYKLSVRVSLTENIKKIIVFISSYCDIVVCVCQQSHQHVDQHDNG